MRYYWIILVCIFCPFIALAQNGIITGKVVRNDTKTPVAGASVFLNNATYGTATAQDGTFTLGNVKPGQYQLVVSTVGYEEFSQTVMAGGDPVRLDIQLTPKVLMLREVVISSAADWKKNYEMFRRDFIGTTGNAKDCKVTNPHVLNLVYHGRKQQLEASSDEFLVVENRALGYRTKFLLNSFLSDGIEHTISYSGKALFEDLPGSTEQKKIWKLKREEAYYGSPQHFYRSLYQNKLKEEGFEVYNFTRYLNPERPEEAVIQQKIKRYKDNRDSLANWYRIANLTKWYHENLDHIPYQPYELLRKTPQAGIYAIVFPHYLYVVYNKRAETVEFKDVYHPLDMPNYETSVITKYSDYYAFDMNGIVISAPSPLYEGTWSKAKLADMVPIDYLPGD